MYRFQLQSVRDQILTSLYDSRRVAVLDVFFKRSAQIHVFAGAIRDAITARYESHDSITPRDFDIGVTGVERKYFDYVLGSLGTKNRHGGYVLREPGHPNWDIWRSEETIGLRKTGVSFSLENVLRSFNLSCNAIALDLRTGVFTDAGAVESIRQRRLGFVEAKIAHSASTFAAKAMLMQVRNGYDISVPIKCLINRHLEKESLLYESTKIFPGLSILPPQNDAAKSNSLTTLLSNQPTNANA